MSTQAPARPERTQSTPSAGATVRTIHSGRTGTVTRVYPDHSASIRWHDRPSDAPDLGHERMPRSLLTVVNIRATCVDALRAAALASSDREALDAVGTALNAIAHAASTVATMAQAPGGVPIGGALCRQVLSRRPDLLGAVQRACLLFTLIEGTNEGTAGLAQTLARIGHSLLADIGHELEKLVAASPLRAAEVQHG